MLRRAAINVVLGIVASIVTCASAALAAAPSVAQIVDRNIAARGGLAQWRAVQSMSLSGSMEAGGMSRPAFEIRGHSKETVATAIPRLTQEPKLPFVLRMQRPRKTRLELQFREQTAIQVYDGVNGWKVRPFLGRDDVEPFTAEEMQAASAQTELDGPLLDYARKGASVEFVGAEPVQERNTYKLKITFADKRVQHVWVDAQTYLEVKMEGAPRRLDGRMRPVAVYLSDYRSVNGLQIPHLMETKVEGVARSEKIFIDSVAINPPMDSSLFGKPKAFVAANSEQGAPDGR